MQLIKIAIMDIRSNHVLARMMMIDLIVPHHDIVGSNGYMVKYDIDLGRDEIEIERVKENNLSIQNASNIFLFVYD